MQLKEVVHFHIVLHLTTTSLLITSIVLDILHKYIVTSITALNTIHQGLAYLFFIAHVNGGIN
jgi:hypothetical protein